jgi:small conductance mechanosensitive channel
MPQWMPATKSHAWEQAGLAAQLMQRDARRARLEALVLAPLIAAVLVAFSLRTRLFPGVDPVWIRLVTFLLLVVLGYRLARDIGRALGPPLLRRLEPGTAGTIGFLVRLATLGLAILVALRVAGLSPETLAVGGAVTGVILGLAAQQTLGHVFSGMVLLSARPFRVGDRVRFIGGPIGGEMEATVSSLGMLYTTLMRDGERVMLPNSIVMQLGVMPLSEPDAVDLRARLTAGTSPTDIQRLLADRVTVATRGTPRIDLEEIDGDEVVVRITATPLSAPDGPQLADEVLAALSGVARSADGDERA